MIGLLPLHNTGWCWIAPLLTPPPSAPTSWQGVGYSEGVLFLQISYICQIFADSVKLDICYPVKTEVWIESDFEQD